MNRKVLVGVASTLIIITIIVAYVIMNRPASPSTRLYLVSEASNASVGQDFSLNISISNVVDMAAWQAKLTWSTTILDAVNATEGSFLKTGGGTFFYHTINNTIGYVMMDCTLLENVSGVNGSGTLAMMWFHVKASGSCDLTLSDTDLVNSTLALIPHTVTSGRFSVSP
jgi:hypothetical protein